MEMIPLKSFALLLTLVIYRSQGKFVLNEINMNDATFKACQYCDARSDRVFSTVAAEALSKFLTTNHIGIVVDGGEVRVKENYPNERIDTGHSCKYTAEARNIVAEAKMIPGSAKLESYAIPYEGKIRNSIAFGQVDHEIEVDLDVRVKGGTKIFGKCHRLWRKTCSTAGKSKGTNNLSVDFAASNVVGECIDGLEHVTFNINAKVIEENLPETYGGVTVEKKGDCNLDIFGIKIGSINGKIQSYASRYLKKQAKYRELRGPKLVAELQRKLGEKLGSLVKLKIDDENGNPRKCSSRRKRSTKCERKNCPSGFTRIGETSMCQKFFGRTRPNCQQFGSKAKLVEVKLSPTLKIYYCHAPMQ